jgi:enamine deaminase RidA (YjgF/YER057c/UK114 family)
MVKQKQQMIKKTGIIFAATLLLIQAAQAQVRQGNVERRLKEQGIELITPSAPVANYVKAVRVGNVVYLSGHGPDKPDGGQLTGKLGSELSIEQGQEAARLVGISLLSTLKREIGNLDKVSRIVKVTGFVNAEPSFEKHPQVMNGFSDLMVQAFGEIGKHARSSVGVGSLPSNIAVEIEMIVELKK